MVFSFFKENKLLEFPKQVEISGNTFDIKVGFYKKKNSSVSLKGSNCLNFRISSYTNNSMAKSHFDDLLKKISVKLSKNSFSLVQHKSFEDVFNQGFFLFSNEKYVFELNSKIRNIKLIDNVFFFNPNIELTNLERLVIRCLIKKYKPRLKEYLFLLNNQTYNYVIKDFDLKLVSSKWGHCSHDNKIMLNLKLLNASKEVLDYVIFHELAHIGVKNHSPRFWQEVSRFCPNHKFLRKKLKECPPGVFN